MMEFSSPQAFAEYIAGVLLRVGQAERKGLTEAAILVQERVKDLVGTEHEGWEALATSTIKEKERLGFTGRVSATDPVLRTGEVRASIEYRVGEHSAAVGSDDPIAVMQEHGTERMPPRPFISTAALESGPEVAQIIAGHVLAELTGQRMQEGGPSHG